MSEIKLEQSEFVLHHLATMSPNPKEYYHPDNRLGLYLLTRSIETHVIDQVTSTEVKRF